jgi:hypothetical protein
MPVTDIQRNNQNSNLSLQLLDEMNFNCRFFPTIDHLEISTMVWRQMYLVAFVVLKDCLLLFKGKHWFGL